MKIHKFSSLEDKNQFIENLYKKNPKQVVIERSICTEYNALPGQPSGVFFQKLRNTKTKLLKDCYAYLPERENCRETFYYSTDDLCDDFVVVDSKIKR